MDVAYFNMFFRRCFPTGSSFIAIHYHHFLLSKRDTIVLIAITVDTTDYMPRVFYGFLWLVRIQLDIPSFPSLLEKHTYPQLRTDVQRQTNTPRTQYRNNHSIHVRGWGGAGSRCEGRECEGINALFTRTMHRNNTVNICMNQHNTQMKIKQARQKWCRTAT